LVVCFGNFWETQKYWIKPAEQATLSPLGDMTSQACEHVLALDGIAVVVNKGNPIASLSREQIRAIFSGQTTDCSKVGGRPGRIGIYARDDRSGTYDTFKSLALESAALSPDAKRFEDSNALPLTLRFIQFATSDADQEVVARDGFVNQIVKKEVPALVGPAAGRRKHWLRLGGPSCFQCDGRRTRKKPARGGLAEVNPSRDSEFENHRLRRFRRLGVIFGF
jgi:hypothetical protein